MKKILFFIMSLFYSSISFSQFTHADSLRGEYGPARSWWDVTKYDLHVKFNLEDSSITGWNEITFKKIAVGKLMQIDLQEPMILDSVFFERFKIDTIRKDGNAYFFTSPVIRSVKLFNGKLVIYYHGKPHIAKNPPWDGGIIWARDKNNNPWITIACQGLGASVWYPCKDHQSDKPDSAELHITAPSELISISNGNLRNIIDNKDGTKTYSWAVINPINNYNIIPYIGKYVNFNVVYKGVKGNLKMNYWILDYNIEKAKEQFTDAPKMMKAFEYWFGPYPFYEDGYKLVEAPHLGMEHQSAIAYGNGFKNGYDGKDLSSTGWGMKWDFIIVHESGHEWFGNNITSKDIADMWIHEGFTNYSETLFTEFYFGRQAANEYQLGLRKKIENDRPVIGTYGVNNEGSVDMYYKGSNMIHTIRQVINNDKIFRNILTGLNQKFYHQTVTTKSVEDYISKYAGINFSKVFDQYLRTTMVPVLEYKIKKGLLFFRWTNVVKGFDMPLKIWATKEKKIFIHPAENFKQIKFINSDLKIDENFYINTRKM